MLNLALVFIGGGAGSVCRYLFGVGWGRLGIRFPFPPTFAINILGGLLMGLLIGVLALRGGGDQEKWRVLVAVGVLGGFTTFSSFSLETVLMIERKDYALAAAYGVGSALFAILAVTLGLFIARKVLA
jgi:CrcB protein